MRRIFTPGTCAKSSLRKISLSFFFTFFLPLSNFSSHTLRVNYDSIRLWFHASFRNSIFQRDIGNVRKSISTIPLMVRDSANKTCVCHVRRMDSKFILFLIPLPQRFIWNVGLAKGSRRDSRDDSKSDPSFCSSLLEFAQRNSRAHFREPQLSSPGVWVTRLQEPRAQHLAGTSAVGNSRTVQIWAPRLYRVDMYFRGDVTGLRQAFPFPSAENRRTVHSAAF